MPVVVALICFLTGCTLIPADLRVTDGRYTVYVVDRGWHTDIGLPADEVTGPLMSLERSFSGTRFMIFGFGQRRYFMAREAGFGDMLLALLPSDGAILMTALRVPPAEAYPGQRVVALHVSPSGAERIAMTLWGDLKKTADGLPLRLAAGPDADSAFYASSETYNAIHTCNTWAALTLRAGGLPIDPHVVFAGQVMGQVVDIAARQELQAK